MRFKRIMDVGMIFLLGVGLLGTANTTTARADLISTEVMTTEVKVVPEAVSVIKVAASEEFVEAAPAESVEINESEDICPLSDDDVELIALVTMAEAEGECEEGKRLVIDTILNRVDSKHFPNTVYDVIYQKNQFSSMWNGRVERCEVRDDICELVREEAAERTNHDVIFFTAGQYSKYGTPMFCVENHYFSSYE